MDRKKLIKYILILLIVFTTVWLLTILHKKNSYTLSDYAHDNPSAAYATHSSEM